MIEELPNFFEDMESLAPPLPAAVGDELELYLRSHVEVAPDPLEWWQKRRTLYPNLSRMALDYLSIPGTSSLTMSLACLTSSYLHHQPPQSTSNVSSAVDGSCSRMCATA